MKKTRHSIAAAVSLLLVANIVLGLVCELRCDVPQSNAVASCHASGASSSTPSPFTLEGADDRCTHDAVPAVMNATLQKELRIAIDHSPAEQTSEESAVVTAVTSLGDMTPVGVRHSASAVLRI